MRLPTPSLRAVGRRSVPLLAAAGVVGVALSMNAALGPGPGWAETTVLADAEPETVTRTSGDPLTEQRIPLPSVVREPLPGSPAAGVRAATPSPLPSTVTAGRAVPVASALGSSGIPRRALVAYQHAADVLARDDATCGVPWHLIAGIGRVESDHGRFSISELGVDGKSRPAIIGIPLDGSPGIALIRDSDGGRLDGDTVLDRAVGPMQFLPQTWAVVGRDGDGDGASDPQDIDDAAIGTGRYLCAGDGDLRTLEGQRAAVFRYNHSTDYVDLVIALSDAYKSGARITGDAAPVPVESTTPAPPVAVPRGGLPPASVTTIDPPDPATGPATPRPSSPSAPPQALPTAPVADPATPEPSPTPPAPEPEPAPSEPVAEPTPGPTESAPDPSTAPVPTEPPTEPSEPATASATPVAPSPGTPTSSPSALPACVGITFTAGGVPVIPLDTNGRQIVPAGEDGSLKVWTDAQGKPLPPVESDGVTPITWLGADGQPTDTPVPTCTYVPPVGPTAGGEPAP